MSDYDVEKARVAEELRVYEDEDKKRNQSYSFFLKKIADIAGAMNFSTEVDEEGAALSINGVDLSPYIEFMDRPGDVLRIVITDSQGTKKVYPPKRNNEYSYNDIALSLIQLAVKKIRGQANEQVAKEFRTTFTVSDKIVYASSDQSKPITIDLTKVENHAMNFNLDDAAAVIAALRQCGFIR